MLDVTVIIPVRDEEKNLPICIGRLKDFAKVVVIESGSSDRTVEVARELGADVIEFEWNGKFPKKRNYVLRNHPIETTWVLFLDADEFITPAFIDEVEAAIRDTPHVGFWLNYERWFLSRQLKHGDEFNKLALFRYGAGEYEKIEEDGWSSLDMEVHEHPVLEGSFGEIRTPIEHNEYRGLRHYIGKHNEYSTWEAMRYLQLKKDPKAWEALTERQKKKYTHITKWWAAPVYFIRGYILKKGFLDGAVGFHFAFMKAVYFYQIRLKIREALQRSAG